MNRSVLFLVPFALAIEGGCAFKEDAASRDPQKNESASVSRKLLKVRWSTERGAGEIVRSLESITTTEFTSQAPVALPAMIPDRLEMEAQLRTGYSFNTPVQSFARAYLEGSDRQLELPIRSVRLENEDSGFKISFELQGVRSLLPDTSESTTRIALHFVDSQGRTLLLLNLILVSPPPAPSFAFVSFEQVEAELGDDFNLDATKTLQAPEETWSLIRAIELRGAPGHAPVVVDVPRDLKGQIRMQVTEFTKADGGMPCLEFVQGKWVEKRFSGEIRIYPLSASLPSRFLALGTTTSVRIAGDRPVYLGVFAKGNAQELESLAVREPTPESWQEEIKLKDHCRYDCSRHRSARRLQSDVYDCPNRKSTDSVWTTCRTLSSCVRYERDPSAGSGGCRYYDEGRAAELRFCLSEWVPTHFLRTQKVPYYRSRVQLDLDQEVAGAVRHAFAPVESEPGSRPAPLLEAVTVLWPGNPLRPL